MKKTYLYKIIFLVSFWVFASAFVVTYEGATLGFKSPVHGESYNFSRILITAVLVTFIAGSAMAIFEVLYFTRLLRKKSFGFKLISKTFFYLSNMFVFISIVVLLIFSYNINKSLFHREVFGAYFDYIVSAKFIMTMLYWGLANLFALFILQVSEKFGQGVLMHFLLGKYHQPKEETRIFMFMDLRSSTTYAEQLGHIKYSQLIQDCFYDLTDIVIAHHAQIYQYVGDEVVLSWEINKGLEDRHCINTFFEYDRVIQEKSDYYNNKYGLIPEFKAGINLGNVTAAEVGELKKELAYHGDVLNTAARIEGKCNDFQRRLLLSEDVKDRLENNSQDNYELMGSIKLRGKEHLVNIYALQGV